MANKPNDAAAQEADAQNKPEDGAWIEAELDEDLIGPDGAIEFKRGDRVFVEGVIIHAHGEGREPAYQSFSVQLAHDGQGIHTNVGNLRLASEYEQNASLETEGEKAQRPARDKRRKPADFTKETVLVGGVPVLREAFEFLAAEWAEKQKTDEATQ